MTDNNDDVEMQDVSDDTETQKEQKDIGPQEEACEIASNLIAHTALSVSQQAVHAAAANDHIAAEILADTALRLSNTSLEITPPQPVEDDHVEGAAAPPLNKDPNYIRGCSAMNLVNDRFPLPPPVLHLCHLPLPQASKV